ncbi:lipase esterase protein, partial [Pseudohyphozyma bogoriensis]
SVDAGVVGDVLTIPLRLHFGFILIPGVVRALVGTLFSQIFFRPFSPVVQIGGRQPFADFGIRLGRYLLGRGSTTQWRELVGLNSKQVFVATQATYDRIYAQEEFKGFKDWINYEKMPGAQGRWIGPPGTRRDEDHHVLLYVHGGGFVLDGGATSQEWLLRICKAMNLGRHAQSSVFALDYHLAPEHQYPVQIQELLAAYTYITTTLSVLPSRITIIGDSAGANLVSAFLLHLARPNDLISPLPPPPRPASVLLSSPYIKLLSSAPSRTSNTAFDYLDNNMLFQQALDYTGSTTGANPRKSRTPSWNPLHWFFSPNPTPPPEESVDSCDLLKNPYASPGTVLDAEWLREAYPGNGRTMITWGEKEIIADDIEQHAAVLEAAGVAPQTLAKPLGLHNWFLVDVNFEGFARTNKNRDEPYWGVEVVCDFVQNVASPALSKKPWDV